MKVLEWKNSKTLSPDGFSSKMETAEERINELKIGATQIVHFDQQREKKI